MFSITSNKRNKLAKLPISALTRPSKPLKKRPYLILTPSIPVAKAPAAKKVRPRAVP